MDFAPGPRVELAAYKARRPTGVPPELANADIVTRGEYLTRAADCAACHTVAGGKPFSGGFAFKLPFGTIYSANITPDPETGIGAWTDDEFVRAVHEGIGQKGERLYPAFPYVSYTAMTREDVLAIKTYLFSLKPVHHVPPKNDLAFPFNQRWLMGVWSTFFNPDQRFRPNASQSAEWNRGAYLAEALAHCGECHTPRNLAQALDNRRKFQGAIIDGWHAYNISSDPNSGVGAWSDATLSEFLSTGHAEGRGTASGPMGEAVDNGLRHLTPGDIKALVTYLRSVPAVDSHDETQLHASSEPHASNELGQHLFEGSCVSCHNSSGVGTITPLATLIGDHAVNDRVATNVIQTILSGSAWKAADGRAMMPSFASSFSDAEVAALANYVVGRFGSGAANVVPSDVAALRKGK
ncbi:c-type cytochrome [Mesorhizobium sp. CU2]|nr:c-type cytochrome [Mesorhizobium sp. CU3]TPO11709.1 c-type cytochrome [Mesorhizobium sp. CU2]